MKPREYFDQVVNPLIRDLQLEPRSLAQLFAAVTTTYHIVDYLAKECGLVDDLKTVKDSIFADFPDFKVIHALALTQKHVEPNSVNIKVGDIRRSTKYFRPVIPSHRLTRLRDLTAFTVTFNGKTHFLTFIVGKCGHYLDKNIEIIEGRLKKAHARRGLLAKPGEP